jgi:hypothetical protein
MGHSITNSHPAAVSPQPDELMVFGFVATFAAMVFYLHRNHSSATELAFAICLIATAAYGFAAGCWPLGVMQLVFTGSSLRRWWYRRGLKPRVTATRSQPRELYDSESRISRMFGSA